MDLFLLSDTHSEAWPDIPGNTRDCWILHAGDVYEGRTQAMPGIHMPEAEYFGSDADPKRLLLARGNHDIADPVGIFAEGRDVSGRLVEIVPGIWVAGLGWHGERWYETPREEDLAPLLRDLGRHVLRCVGLHDHLILLTHYPPCLSLPAYGCEGAPGQKGLEPDLQTGTYQCVREWIEEYKPSLVVAGHIHEWFGRSYRVLHSEGDAICIVPGPKGYWLDAFPDCLAELREKKDC